MNNIKQIEIGSIKSKLGTGTTISTPIFSSNYKGLLKPIHWNQINCDDEFVLRTFEGNELYWQDSKVRSLQRF